MAEGVHNSANLRHGDIVALMCDGPTGFQGYLSSSSPSVREAGSSLRVAYEPARKDKDMKKVNPEFLSTCLWRIDTSQGEGAPGGHARLINSHIPKDMRRMHTMKPLIPPLHCKYDPRLGRIRYPCMSNSDTPHPS